MGIMDTGEMKWQDIVKNAFAYKKIGQTTIYLYCRDNAEPPWHLATCCEPGGSHRLDIATSVRFEGKHESGITFSWSFDLENYGANGSQIYQFNRERIANVLARLQPATAEKLRKYLLSCIAAINKKGEEYQGYANKQFNDAQMLRVIAAVE